jgi:hypothetical protein
MGGGISSAAAPADDFRFGFNTGDVLGVLVFCDVVVVTGSGSAKVTGVSIRGESRTELLEIFILDSIQETGGPSSAILSTGAS